MKVFVSVSICSLAVFTMFSGCESSSSSTELPTTGFLSSYAGLKPISKTSYRYINPKYDLGNYTKFIIDPVEVIFSRQTKGEVKSWDDIEKLKAYMPRALVDSLEPRYTVVMTRPGPGVGRIRVALTDVERSAPFKLGSISMEVELLDSQTSEQIAALIESQKKGVPFYGYDPWSGAKAVMDDMAKRFYNRLEEAHGY
ncbi:MAG: DUF3313 family protein [Gammaproteobacteria bacterium]|nr:DUF3313 family protein [Gammaproteobacteria bacterium]